MLTKWKRMKCATFCAAVSEKYKNIRMYQVTGVYYNERMSCTLRVFAAGAGLSAGVVLVFRTASTAKENRNTARATLTRNRVGCTQWRAPLKRNTYIKGTLWRAFFSVNPLVAIRFFSLLWLRFKLCSGTCVRASLLSFALARAECTIQLCQEGLVLVLQQIRCWTAYTCIVL